MSFLKYLKSALIYSVVLVACTLIPFLLDGVFLLLFPALFTALMLPIVIKPQTHSKGEIILNVFSTGVAVCAIQTFLFTFLVPIDMAEAIAYTIFRTIVFTVPLLVAGAVISMGVKYRRTK